VTLRRWFSASMKAGKELEYWTDGGANDNQLANLKGELARAGTASHLVMPKARYYYFEHDSTLLICLGHSIRMSARCLSAVFLGLEVQFPVPVSCSTIEVVYL
jgi:hypothetical protein